MENEEKKVLTEEEKIYEIEKKLGRHAKKEKDIKQMKKQKKFMKYFLLVTNMVYLLTVPILAMIGFYILLKKSVFKEEKPLVLIIFIILGVITGYWSLIKELMKINKFNNSERKKENDSTK